MHQGEHLQLTSERLDHLAALEFAGQSLAASTFVATELSAYLEFYWLRAAGRTMGALHKYGPFDEMHNAMRSSRSVWTSRAVPHRGFVKVRRAHTDVTEARWVQFRFEFERALVAGGFAPAWAKQLIGATGELEDNIHNHSENVPSGLVAYWVHAGFAEIVVMDRGIGVLSSLGRAEEFASLSDHGTALRLALRNGTSRYGTNTGRGWGFDDLITGLANRKALLRFRSGDHAVSIDGSAGLPGARLSQRSPGDGFLISVRVSPA